MDKVGFHPGVELFYVDAFAPPLPEQHSRPEKTEEEGRTPSRSPASSPRNAGESGKCTESDRDESFHSVSVCHSHPSPLRPSDASEASNSTHPCENPSPALVLPVPLTPSSSSPPGLGSGPWVALNSVVVPSQSQLQEVSSAGSSSSGVHAGGPPRSSPPLPSCPGSSLPEDSPSPREATGSPSSQIPSPGECIRSNSSAAEPSGEVKPSSAKPDAKKCKEESKHSPPVLSVSKGSAPKPPPTPLPSFLPPPPPRPPSLKKGGSPGQAAPPLPPGQFPPPTAPVGKDGSPLPKLKPLYWDKVRAAPGRAMVWDRLKSSSFELDEEMIESLFGSNQKSSGRTGEVRNKASSTSKHVLEHKRLQNFTVLLRALNATSDQVCGGLLRGSGLCAQQLEALVKMVPTKEEEERLLRFEGDIGKLDPAERFVREIWSIPFSFPRIEVMLYRETFDDEVALLRKSIQMLEEACKELRSSRLFLRLLEAVLKTGNRMNVGTGRGDARAFKLDTLLKLVDVKGADGKTTLLHFVVHQMARSEGATVAYMAAQKADQKKQPKAAMGLELVSRLSAELLHVKTAAGIDLDALTSSVSTLSTGLEKLQHLLEHHDLKADLSQEVFVHSMKSFSNYAARTIRELEEDEGRVFQLVRGITEYYHGAVGKEEANPLGIFVIVRDFLGMLDRVCKEVRSMKGHHSTPMAAPPSGRWAEPRTEES